MSDPGRKKADERQKLEAAMANPVLALCERIVTDLEEKEASGLDVPASEYIRHAQSFAAIAGIPGGEALLRRFSELCRKKGVTVFRQA